MEDDLNESSSSMLPIALALLAIALGGAGLYFGMSANQRINPISDNIEERSGSAARIEKQLASFEAQLTELVAQNEELKGTVNRVRMYGSQSEQTAKQAISGVKDNREELVKLVKSFNELSGGGISTRPNQAAAATATTSPTTSRPTITSSPTSSFPASGTSGTITVTSDSTVPGNPAAATYRIQSGDNFAKVATQKGVSLQALLDANPGVDPRSLQIGQRINVPSN